MLLSMKLAPLLASLLLLAPAVVMAAGEPYRPQFHFTPERNWMNDPNGLVFFEGEYHLFYQYNPQGDTWGHMSWGHAVSRDLVRWEPLPPALAEEDGIMIFSGSAVVDWKNTSGFGQGGKPPLVAIYTGHRKDLQDQRLAFSNDRGRTWTKYPGNPVLDIGKADFRDPKVFWHEPIGLWVMVIALAAEKRVQLHTSPDLKSWKLASEFGPAGATGGLWECPDLFPLRVEGEAEVSKWVLVVNINPGGPAGGSGCQYFVGDFDGRRFVPDANPDVLWADRGADFYAAVSWSDVPDGERIWIGWMSNWEYANKVPTSPWRSAMSVPRTLALRRTSAGLRLIQSPIPALQGLRKPSPRILAGGSVQAAGEWLAAQRELGTLLEVEIVLADLTGAAPCTIHLHTGAEERTSIQCDPVAGRISIDRSRSGNTKFHPAFPARHEAPVRLVDGRLSLRLLLDTGSLEVFAEGGETVFTELLFPSPGTRSLTLETGEGKAPTVEHITIHELKPAS